MYEHVLINPKHRNLQRILWRVHTSDTLKTYLINTVTYSQAAASFLSLRCLFELTDGLRQSMPDISPIIEQVFCAANFLSGANTISYKVASISESGVPMARKFYRV